MVEVTVVLVVQMENLKYRQMFLTLVWLHSIAK